MLLPLIAASARAEDRAAAREAFRRGSQHYKLGEYKEALVDFKAAYRNFEDPSFLFNIAQCERLLDLRTEAIREFKMFLAESPDAPNREEVRALITKLQEELAAEKSAAHAADKGADASAASGATPPAAPTPAPATKPALVAPAALVVAAAPPPRKPAYKKWWVWTLTGLGVAAAATAIAVPLTVGQRTEATLPMVHVP